MTFSVRYEIASPKSRLKVVIHSYDNQRVRSHSYQSQRGPKVQNYLIAATITKYNAAITVSVDGAAEWFRCETYSKHISYYIRDVQKCSSERAVLARSCLTK